MKISIRQFLLTNLLIAIVATTTLTTIGNYYIEEKDIRQHLDAQLSQSTLSFQALFGSDINTEAIARAQESLNKMLDEEKKLEKSSSASEDIITFANQYQFQVWDKQGNLLLHTPNAPQAPMSAKITGFSDKNIDGNLWRVFTLVNPHLGIAVVAAERYDLREKLSHQITKDYLQILLLTYPVFAFLIWLIIGKGLNTIKQVSREIANRAPTYLEPVDIEMIPVEVKPLIDELNKLFLRLQKAFEREKRFAADAAHELKTPLAALRAQAEVALKSKEDKERRIQLQSLISSVDRTSHVVSQLLTLSRLTKEDSYESEMFAVDLNKIATEIIAQLAPIAVESNIDIQFDTTEKSPLLILSNPAILGTLIQNLVDNAIRYTPPNGEVTVSTHTTEKSAIIRVCDNGPGIPSEYRARVFERFFRVFGTEKPGSGLGLAIVKQIADLHHAKIKLGSPPNGVGLEVEVSFNKLQ